MKTEIHIMLVEDNPSYRGVIDMTITDAPDMQLISIFGTAEAALQALVDSSEKPDIILLDIRLPGMSGIQSIPQIKKASPETHIIMLTQSKNEKDVVKAIQSGATGYLLKSSSIEEITQGIRTVAGGGSSLNIDVARYIVEALHTESTTDQIEIQLSGRESEILILLSEGLVKKQIADQLGIGIHTVGDHVKNIYQKLQVPNAPAAISKAYRSGILSTKENDEEQCD